MTNKDMILNDLNKNVEKLAKILIDCNNITGWDEIPTYEYITSDGVKFDDDSYYDSFNEAIRHEVEWLNKEVKCN